MGGWGGLIELVLVVAVIFGWGLLELRATKLDSKKAARKQDEAEK